MKITVVLVPLSIQPPPSTDSVDWAASQTAFEGHLTKLLAFEYSFRDGHTVEVVRDEHAGPLDNDRVEVDWPESTPAQRTSIVAAVMDTLSFLYQRPEYWLAQADK